MDAHGVVLPPSFRAPTIDLSLYWLLQGNGTLWLFTTAAYGATQIGHRYAHEPMNVLAIALRTNPCGSILLGPQLCALVTVTKASLGFADPWLSYTLEETAAAGSQATQGKLQVQVETIQDSVNSPYAKFEGGKSMFAIFKGIPFILVPNISPLDALACSAVPVITNGAGPQVALCDVQSVPNSVSFVLLGPNPRRLIDSTVTGPINNTWTLGQSEFDVVAGLVSQS